MDNRTHLGINRTGVQMSPLLTADMMTSQAQFPEPTPGLRGDVEMRLSYADQTAGLGSVPVPGSVKGMLASGLDMVTGKRPQVLIDKLGERLAFERGGTRLYESLLIKCRGTADPLPAADLEALVRFRDEEAEHFELVARALERLGADPTAQTPCADLVGVQSLGLVQAMNDPRTSLVQCLNVMLNAELIDNAGWELLVELARDTGHDEIADQCAYAARQEAEHLLHVRNLVARLTLKDASLIGSLVPHTSDSEASPMPSTLAATSSTAAATTGVAAAAATGSAMASASPLADETSETTTLEAAGNSADWAGDPAQALRSQEPDDDLLAEPVALSDTASEPMPMAFSPAAGAGTPVVPAGLTEQTLVGEEPAESPELARLPDAMPDDTPAGLDVTSDEDADFLEEDEVTERPREPLLR